MSTQYNDIADKYVKLYGDLTPENFPMGEFEEAQIYAVAKDLIKGKHVLDLACGTGFYSRRYLQWGAQSVVGLDISNEMIKHATLESQKSGIPKSQLDYVVADVCKAPDLGTYGAPFDVITASWLLNYAPDLETMTQMWETVSKNLKPEGVFIGLTNPPQDGSMEGLNNILKGTWGAWGCRGHVIRPVRDGFAVHNILGIPGTPPTEFDNFYLRSEIFENSIKPGGMNGGLEWQGVVVPDTLTRKHPKGFFNDLVLRPHCRVCLAWKQ